MAIKLIANYAKRLGLPGYSSHQFSVTCETELTDLAQAPEESSRLYDLLQGAVDREIQQTGFVPGDDYGEGQDPEPHPQFVRPVTNTHRQVTGDRTAQSVPVTRRIGTRPTTRPTWRCSDRQRELLDNLAAELGLDEAALDTRSRHLYGRSARELNKANASGLISELLAEVGTRRQPRADAA